MENEEPLEETEELLNESFVWDEHHWDCLWPESTGLPVFVFVDVSRADKVSIPLIMFYPRKNQVKLEENARFHSIPMVICDEPYIPDEYKHRKHELTDEELSQIKTWVAKYKDILALSNAYIDEKLEKTGALKPVRWEDD